MTPEVADQNPECDEDSDCLAPGAVCVPQHYVGGGYHGMPMHPSIRRCTLHPDRDFEGVGDDCDNCLDVPNPWNGPGQQANCNVYSDGAAGAPYPYRPGDACDPNPCARLDVTSYHPGCGDLEPEAPEWQERWLRLHISPGLLPRERQGVANWESVAYWYDAAPQATVGLRTCVCEFDAWECRAKCPLNHSECSAAVSTWKVPTVVATEYGQSGMCGAPDPHSLQASAEFYDLDVAASTDAGPAGLEHYGHVAQYADWYLGRLLVPLQRVLWSHVVELPGLREDETSIPSILPSDYRPYSNHYLAGDWGEPADVPSGDGFRAIAPWHVIERAFCPQCGYMLDVPNIYIQPATKELIARGRPQQVNVAVAAEPDLLDAMSAGAWDWVAVAEPAEWHLAAAEAFAAVAPDATAVGVVAAIRGGALKDIVGEFGPVFGGAVTSAASAPGAATVGVAPSSRTEFGAVLSATEHALFVVGGVGSEGELTQDVWRFDVRMGTWRQLRFSGEVPRRVLAATYRPSDRALYVLDEDLPRGDWGSDRRGRLLRFDLRSRQAVTLGEWRRKSGFDRHYLSNASRGELMLLGTSQTKGRYRGVRFGYHPESGLTMLGWFQGKGYLAAPPTLTERGLTLPTLVDGEVSNEFRSRADLEGGPPHSFAECM